jgi:hypothetical protein
MKTLALICLLALTGCESPTVIQSDKVTVFGFEGSYQGTGLRFGLVRHYYFRVPTSTNCIYAPVFNSDTTADISMTHQSANERFSTGSTNFQFITNTAVAK